MTSVAGGIVVGFRLMLAGGTFFDMGEPLLEALGNEVKLSMGRLRVARNNGVEHGDQLFGIGLDLKVLLLDDAAHFTGTSDGYPHLH